MPRFFVLAVWFASLSGAFGAYADDAALYEKIRIAKESYQKDVAKLRDDVQKNLKKAEDSARKTGNKSLLDKIKQESEAFSAKGLPPTVISTKEGHRKIRKARETLEELYNQSIKALTKSGMDDAADTLKKELRAFQIKERVFEGKHYCVMNPPLLWHEAQSACENQGGHLAIIRTEAESLYLISLLKAEAINASYIGATDEKKEGLWLWVDETLVSYANWDRVHAQPNNRGNQGQPEHYALIILEYDGKWWDTPDFAFPFICQWD